MASGELVKIESSTLLDTPALPGITGELVDSTESSDTALAGQSDAAYFLDPETRIRIGVSKQLSIMSKFWATLGYKMPDLTPDQEHRLQQSVAWHPVMYRLLPAPFLSAAERIQAVERARVFPSSTLDNKYMGLDFRDDAYRAALANPHRPAIYNGKQYGLGYSTHDDRVVGRQEYIRTLMMTDNVVQGKQGRVWAFPLVNLASIGSEVRSIKDEDLKVPVEPTLIPESLIGLCLLRDIADRRSFSVGKKEGIANEALYELNGSEPVNLSGVVQVTHSSIISQIHMAPFAGATNHYEYGRGVRFFHEARIAVSGLGSGLGSRLAID